MYTIILSFAITLIGMAIFYYKTEYETWRDFEMWLLWVFCSVASGLISAFCGFMVALCFSMDYETVKWDRKIVSLKDNSSIKGRFFLGSGHIEGSMKYVFYVENNDDSYSMKMLDYYEARIKYSKNAPKLKTTQTRPIKNQWNNWAIDAHQVHTKYLIEVPNGTIKNDFKLDSE
jgi:hypothetical protein